MDVSWVYANAEAAEQGQAALIPVDEYLIPELMKAHQANSFSYPSITTEEASVMAILEEEAISPAQTLVNDTLSPTGFSQTLLKPAETPKQSTANDEVLISSPGTPTLMSESAMDQVLSLPPEVEAIVIQLVDQSQKAYERTRNRKHRPGVAPYTKDEMTTVVSETGQLALALLMTELAMQVRFVVSATELETCPWTMWKHFPEVHILSPSF